jgi:hypothetical protein
MKSNLILGSGWTFFVLSTDYKKNQLSEILFLVKRGFSYGDILSMPIYIRQYYVNYIIELENS